jgi:outer membrane protein with beta-barrel domain
MVVRVTVFCMALLTATTAIAQSQSKLEVGTRQGNYYWVVETGADGSRRGGWVPVNVPLDAIDRNALKPLPPVSALSPEERAPQAPVAPPTVDERLAKIEQTLANGQGVTAQPLNQVQSAPVRQVGQQPRPQSPAPVQHTQSREGFWFSGGFGYGSLGCDACFDRADGFSGGLALGGTLNEKVLLGVGTTAWYRSEDGVWLNAGTFDARVRFYPSLNSGFFINGGLGLGTISLGVAGYGSDSETGVGLMLGLGWDIRVGSNVSLSPFWNGSAVRTSNANANFGQLGLGVTIH